MTGCYDARRVAIVWPDLSFLLAARELGVSFDSTLMVGRQNLFATAPEIVHAYQDAGQSIELASAERIVADGQGFCEPLLRHLGAGQVESLDASDFEHSTYVHDLNQPLPEDLRSRYTLVYDGGTLEHVFNLPQALKNCMQAVAPGGHFITIGPATSQYGHGFYQFSPELYYRALSPENGYEVLALLIRTGNQPWTKWRAVADPATLGVRVDLASPWETFMFVLARRTAEIEPFASWPQQSDYSSAWTGTEVNAPMKTRTRLISHLPKPVRSAIMTTRSMTAVLGKMSGPDHFRPVEMADVARGALRAARRAE